MSGKKVVFSLFFLLLIFSLFPLVNAAGDSVNIALYHLTPKQELCRCEAFNYNFVVYNTGSLNETYSFSVSRYAPNFNISPSTITIEPKETANIGVGARLPCSLTQPKIDFIARTKATRLRAKTPLQLSVNSSCFAPDINITRVMPREVKALSILLVSLTVLVVILLLIMFILQKRPKEEYWWSSYFKLRPERRIAIIEIIAIIIVVIFLMLLGLKGFQQIGMNQTLIQRNVTQPINITMRPVVEKIGTVSKTLCSGVKQLLWPYKFYILIGLILLILIIIMSVIVMRRRRIKVKPEKIKRVKIKPEKIRKIRRIKWRYIIIPLIIIILLALIAVSAFLIYKNRSKIKSFLSQITTKLELSKVKNFLLPKLRTLLDFVKDAFEFVRPYLIYVIIGIILLVIIILVLRRREKRLVKVVSVKEKIPEKRRERRKKRKKKTKKKK